MSKMTWFKLHSDFRNDPKIKRLPIAERYAFIVLLCLANESETRGTIAGLDDDDIAFELEMQSEDWQTLKAKFKIKGFIDFTKDQVLIRNWDKRQYDKPSDHPEATKQRKRLQREKIKLSKAEDITPMSRDVTPMSRTRVDQSRSDQIRSEEIREEEKEEDSFFSDSPDLDLAMQKELKSSVAIADQEDPAPLPPVPLSDAAIALKAKFEAKFDRKANKYEPQGLTGAGYGEWHLGTVEGGTTTDSYNNWKPSLIVVAQKRKRSANQLDTPIAAADYIYNIARSCCREGHWGRFGNLATESIAYEEALKANQAIGNNEATTTNDYMVRAEWLHFYPESGIVSRENGEAIIFWHIEGKSAPPPIAKRCANFLTAKLRNDPNKLAKLLNAKHCLAKEILGYAPQVKSFAQERDSLITAFKQEIEKLLLQPQAA